MRIKRLTKGVVLGLTDAEVGDLHGVLGRLESRNRLVSKRELKLLLKLSGLAEAIVGRRNILALTDEQRSLPEYEAAARAMRGIWQTVRV
jgi:hypothetical protein